jgi:NADH dehydrogenase
MLIRNVLVTGGSGLLGRHVVRQLAALDIQVRVPTRNRERAKQLILLPTVDVVKADITTPRPLNA